MAPPVQSNSPLPPAILRRAYALVQEAHLFCVMRQVVAEFGTGRIDL
jgi:hypothetical protein